MSASVRLRRLNGVAWETAYTFPVTPFVSPSLVAEHNDAEPPRITGTRYTWTVEALLDGTRDEVIAKYDELLAAIEGEPPAQGIQLLSDGVVVEEISPEGGFLEVKIESLSSPKTETQWTTDVVVQLRVTGFKRIADPNAPDPNDPPSENDEDPVGALEQTLTYSYDEAGLLTKTLSGEVASDAGGAEALARAFALNLPGSDFAYVTRGPEGVDVEVLDQGGTRARFTSTIRQSGATLPAGVGPGFSVRVESVTVDGEITTTTSVSAEGTGAEAAVKSKRPSGTVSETITVDAHRRTATAVYVKKKKAADALPVKRHRFKIAGGGRPIRWTRRSGGREPVKHLGAFTEVQIEEEVTVEVLGRPKSLADFKLPPPLSTVDQDTSRTQIEGPERETAKDASSAEKWTVTLRRFYAAARFQPAYVAVLASVVAPGDSATLDGEASRQDEGLPPNG